MNTSVFSFINEGNVWKVLADGEFLIVEVRNGELRSVELVCITINEQRIVWKSSELGWWDSLLGVRSGKIYINTYSDPKFPETKGGKVLSLDTGHSVWETKDHVFVSIQDNKVLVAIKEENSPEFFYLDSGSGQLLGKASLEKHEESSSRDEEGLVQAPSLYYENQDYFLQVAKFLERVGKTPVKVIEYIEVSDKVIIGIYEKRNNNFQNILLIFSENGDLLHTEIMESESEGIGMGTFFVIKELLVFVRDKKEIVILHLNT